MKYLEVPGWEKYQSGRRSPGAPWIKLHVKLLHNPEFNRLPAGARWLLISIWMCTALRGHWVDFDHTYLQDMAHLGRSYRTLWVQKLITAGFLRVVETRSCTEKEIEREREKKLPPTPLLKPPPSTRQPPRNRAQAPSGLPAGFCEFWTIWPKKIAKLAALKAWKQLKLEPATDHIVRSVNAWKDHPDWSKDGGRFIPHPSKWLREGRYHDEMKLDPPKPPPFRNRLLTDEEKAANRRKT